MGCMKHAIFKDAVNHWWRAKAKGAQSAQRSQGSGRDANLKGDTMDGFRVAIQQMLTKAGVAENDIYFGPSLSQLPSNLPGYFRTTKNWDLVVCKNARHKVATSIGSLSSAATPRLVVAVEFKSQTTSIGNNQNNRMEEALGSAHDFWAAYERKLFVRLQPRPWLGFLFMGLYEKDELNEPVTIRQPLFPVDPVFAPADDPEWVGKSMFKGPSYAERYRIYLERLIGTKLYDGACFVVTNASDRSKTPNYRTVFEEFSDERFKDALLRHVKAYYPD